MSPPPLLPAPFIALLVCCQGDVWICMELMDTSLDKFYKQVIEKGSSIPEDILGKIAVSVGLAPRRRRRAALQLPPANRRLCPCRS